MAYFLLQGQYDMEELLTSKQIEPNEALGKAINYRYVKTLGQVHLIWQRWDCSEPAISLAHWNELSLFTSIPVIIQNASFGLLLFSPKQLLKTRNRMGYYSLLKAAWTKKSSRPKTSILNDHGYIN